MAANDPKQIIIEFFCRPPSELVPPTLTAEGRTAGVPQSQTPDYGGYSAKKETIQFHKERSLPHRQVHAVTFENAEGLQWLFICFMLQDVQGQWRLEAAGGGGGGSSEGGSVKESSHGPKRGRASANLAGGGWEDHFWAGGYVYENGLPVTKVRLTSKNGVVLEDTVQDDLVLFVTDQKIQAPMDVELYSLSGELVGKHSKFEHHAAQP